VVLSTIVYIPPTYIITYVVYAQSTEKWLAMDRELLAMTENVDYDVEGIVAMSSLSHRNIGHK